ncbi:unnamed protein product, partial [Phaedon cochleariae]
MLKLIVYCAFFMSCCVGGVDSQWLGGAVGVISGINGTIPEIGLTDNLTSMIENVLGTVGNLDTNSIIDLICQVEDGFLSISKLCESQIKVLCHKVDLRDRMWDASAKFPYPGMDYATRTVMGNYDECMTINHHDNGTRILGKYCISGMLIPDLKNISNLNLIHKLDICIPDECSADDLRSIFAIAIDPNIPLFFLDEFCSTKESGKEFTAANIIVTCLFLAIVCLMLVSTAYDVYLYKTEQKTSHPLFLAFSILSNGRKLFSPIQYSKDRIEIFNGIKVLSMMWIIAGHGFGTFTGTFSVLNQGTIDSFREKRYSGYIDAAHVAVDTFFFMSGYLLSYHYFKDNSRSTKAQVKNIPFIYVHRYLRITPPVLMMYLSSMFIFVKFGSGPYWQPGAEIHLKPCREYWWSYILFIQNYVNWDNMCLVPHWYLSVDLQCFILSPLFLIPTSRLLKKPDGFKYSMIFLMVMNLVCIILPMMIWLRFPDYKNEYGSHSRLTDFMIGITMGVFMRTKRDEPFLKIFDRKKITNINFAIWMIVLVGMFTVVFFYQDAEMNQSFIQRMFYFGLSRPAWCISLCWVLYSCYHGYGGIVNWILTRSIFQIGSKLAFCMYIVHYTVIGHYSLSNRMKWYFSDYVE